MVARHISMRGDVIDMERLRIQNGDVVALGNASKNARGDIVGQNGTVVKTQEQIEQEWAASRAKKAAQSKPVDIKAEQSLAQAVANLAPKPRTTAMDDQDFAPPPAPVAPPPTQQAGSRRRVVESDQ